MGKTCELRYQNLFSSRWFWLTWFVVTHLFHFLSTLLIVLVELFFLLWRQQVVHLIFSTGAVEHTVGLRFGDGINL